MRIVRDYGPMGEGSAEWYALEDYRGTGGVLVVERRDLCPLIDSELEYHADTYWYFNRVLSIFGGWRDTNERLDMVPTQELKPYLFDSLEAAELELAKYMLVGDPC